MSITRTTTLVTQSTYPDIGITINSGTQSVDLVYTVTRIVDFNGTQATAEYSVTAGGVASATPFRLMFPCAATDNPLAIAETALSNYFAALDKAAADATAAEASASSTETTTNGTS